METLKLKPAHVDTVIGKLIDFKKAIDYHLEYIKPRYSKMEPWERKEYEKVFQYDLEELKHLKFYLMDNEPLFNKMLSEYNLSVAVFIAKYLNIATE